MKLRGDINADAQERLYKSFLPALEKMGKTVQVLLRREQVMLVQMQDDGTEGGLVKLELPTDYIFSHLLIQSNKDNTIAFSLSVGLLVKILASANAIEAEGMQMVLTQVNLTNDDGSPALLPDGTPAKQPILRFLCVGHLHSSTQELPISKPYTGSQIDDLVGMLASLSLNDWYVNIMPHVSKAEALLHTVGRQSPFVQLLTSHAGELHMQVVTDSVVQGLEITPLDVFPADQARPDDAQQAGTADERFLAALALDGSSHPRAEVLTKSLSKALGAASLTAADMLLLSCGNDSRPVLHLLCVFMHNGEIVSDYALHVWLPTREEGVD